jgi:molybdopterin synthase sulfur carrier subunit
MTVSAVALVEPAPSASETSVRVLCFGRIADPYGRSISVAIPARGCTLNELRARIARQVDGAGHALADPCIRVAIDQVIAVGDAWVSPGQEVAFLSAFSGG